MLFLSGLLGMMALGSLAIVGTGALEEDEVAADAGRSPDLGEDEGLAGDWPAVEEPVVDAGQWPQPDDGVYDQGRSLFARMGLINVPWETASDDTVVDPDPGGNVLQLDNFRIEDPTVSHAAAEQPDLLDFDDDEDQLVIVYDDSAGPGDPALELRVSPDDTDVTEILLDGAVLGRMPAAEAPELDNIVLVGESAAASLNLG